MIQVTRSSSSRILLPKQNLHITAVQFTWALLRWFITNDLLNVNIDGRMKSWEKAINFFKKQQYYLTFISLTTFAVHMHIMYTSLCEYMDKVFFCSLAHCIILMKKHEKEHCTMMKKTVYFTTIKSVFILLNEALRYLSFVFVK